MHSARGPSQACRLPQGHSWHIGSRRQGAQGCPSRAVSCCLERSFGGGSQRFYEGQGQDFSTKAPSPGTFVQYFKDDATRVQLPRRTGHHRRQGRAQQPAFRVLHAGASPEIGVPTHFIKRLNMRAATHPPGRDDPPRGRRAQHRRRVRSASGSASPRAPLFRSRSSSSTSGRRVGDPWSPRSTSPPSAGPPSRTGRMVALALGVNDFLSGASRRRHPPRRLQDRDRPDLGQRLPAPRVADEISPDSCRLWDIETARARQGRVPPRPWLSDGCLCEGRAAFGVLPERDQCGLRPRCSTERVDAVLLSGTRRGDPEISVRFPNRGRADPLVARRLQAERSEECGARRRCLSPHARES